MLKEDGMNMEIRAIETFHAVVKFGSFQKAAEALNYSQPTITFRIKQLETDLGVQLFKRGKQAQLTTSGRLFLEKSAKLFFRIPVCFWKTKFHLSNKRQI